jgi:hypothetical protein
MRTQERTLNEEPMKTWSRIEQLLPKRHTPKMLALLPRRAKERQLTAEPKLAKSSRDMLELIREIPKTERAEPSLQKDLCDRPLPMCAQSSIDRALPNRHCP